MLHTTNVVKLQHYKSRKFRLKI